MPLLAQATVTFAVEREASNAQTTSAAAQGAYVVVVAVAVAVAALADAFGWCCSCGQLFRGLGDAGWSPREHCCPELNGLARCTS